MPQYKGADDEEKLPKFTKKVLFSRQEANPVQCPRYLPYDICEEYKGQWYQMPCLDPRKLKQRMSLNPEQAKYNLRIYRNLKPD